MSQATVITLDGPSGSGKGTIAGLLAARLGWRLLDSGALYRLLAFAAGNHGIDLTNEEGLKTLAAHLDVQFIAGANGQGQRIILEGDEVTDVIRTETVGAGASQVAALPAVREALLQRPGSFVPGYSGPSGWVGLDLDEATDWDEVAELIAQSFLQTAPARLARQLAEFLSD